MDRYSRQILFPGLGQSGQQRLASTTVAIIGCGALGTLHAAAMARAGAGRLLLIDRDYVELSNLQRQWLFTEADANEGTPKAIAAARALVAVNSSIAIEPFVADLTPSNIADLLSGATLILDGTDNFEARFLINDWSVAHSVPWVYGAAVGSYGLVMPVLPGRSACLRCLYPSPPTGAQPTCETAGVLNTITATVAAWQCAAAQSILAASPEAQPSHALHITTFDVWTGAIRQTPIPPRDPECPACARGEFPYLNNRHRAPISLCGRNAVQIHERNRPLDLQALAATLAPLGTVRVNEFALRFFPHPYEITVFPDGRAILKGTTDPAVARGLYARYIGA
ncbi:MAG: thiazole biosynthesis adenylyltransferase ThiF [Acidobacteria bacterium]|nr:thiazole biosynthesis adenylyltransferase ThiF [Acidobacteriota bacterium]